MIVWAIVSGCTAATSSFGSLVAVRFCLGFVEAPFFPGAIYFLSCWYTKRELGIRMALLVSGIMVSIAFAGLISAGILTDMDGATKLAAWRWLFIIEGLVTVVLALAAMCFLPDFPATTKWLTDAERIVAQGRLAEDAGSEETLEETDNISLLQALVLAASDIRVWLFSCMQMATTVMISFSNFFPTLVQDLGFSNRTVVLLLTSPPYVVAFFWSMSWAWVADRRQTRSLPSGLSEIVGMVGTVILMALPENLRWSRYVFTFFVSSGSFGVYCTTYAWLSSTVTQPRVKRAASIGLANTWANLAALYSSYFWLDKYAPTFRVSWGILLAFEVLGMTCILTLQFLLRRANRRFERLASTVTVDDTSDPALVQQLDGDSKRAVLNGFRYVT